MLTLKDFDGKKVKAITTGGYCAEDNDKLKAVLARKYAEEPVEEKTFFRVAGQVIVKPWLQRERIGIFKTNGKFFYIENHSGSMPEVQLPKRALHPTTNLTILNETTLELTVSSKQKIVYTLIDE